MKSLLAVLLAITLSSCAVDYSTENSQEQNSPGTKAISPTLTEKESVNEDKEMEDITWQIVRVIDGDTIIATRDGERETVRIVGIDTPETSSNSYRPEGCYGDNATAEAKSIMNARAATLLRNKSGDNRDKYDRLLRYVFIDGQDIGAQLIESGYAYHYDRFAHDRKSYYRDLEKSAQESQVGVWNQENCSYWEFEG